jgi:hypothetical protein
MTATKEYDDQISKLQVPKWNFVSVLAMWSARQCNDSINTNRNLVCLLKANYIKNIGQSQAEW